MVCAYVSFSLERTRHSCAKAGSRRGVCRFGQNAIRVEARRGLQIRQRQVAAQSLNFVVRGRTVIGGRWPRGSGRNAAGTGIYLSAKSTRERVSKSKADNIGTRKMFRSIGKVQLGTTRVHRPRQMDQLWTQHRGLRRFKETKDR